MTGHPAMDQDEVELAHEALRDHWPRLRSWLEADQVSRWLRAATQAA
jgi:hypothetical protein